VSRLPQRALLCLLLASLQGCGARTGLGLPEPNPEPDSLICIELPPEGSQLLVPLATEAQLERIDVFMLMDVTGSMGEELAEIADRLRTDIAPAIYTTIPDTQFGIGTFADFPMTPYGESGDSPYELRLPMTGDLVATQNVLDSLSANGGGDNHETQVEALYQVATGEGLGEYIEPRAGCLSGGAGGPCFRRDAQSTIMLFTDAPFHGGPSSRRTGAGDYFAGTLAPEPHSYTDAMNALIEQRIRVIGLWSGGDGPVADLEMTVADSGGVGADGEPIVFDIGSRGQNLGTGTIDALREFAGGLVYDVDVEVSDPVISDGVDTVALIERVKPVRADPMGGIAGIDLATDTFLGVVAGTTLIFEVAVVNNGLRPGPEPQRYRVLLTFRGDGSIYLGVREVELVVPALDGRGCEMPMQ